MEKRLPDHVTLSCIGYRVQEAEGLIVFTEAEAMWGITTRFAFERDCDGMCWYVKIFGTRDSIMVSHMIQAYEIVCAAYGKNFETKSV